MNFYIMIRSCNQEHLLSIDKNHTHFENTQNIMDAHCKQICLLPIFVKKYVFFVQLTTSIYFPLFCYYTFLEQCASMAGNCWSDLYYSGGCASNLAKSAAMTSGNYGFSFNRDVCINHSFS
jgi:hypothetical protein